MMGLVNKKIGILGLAEENLAMIKYLAKIGAKDMTICDQKSGEELTGYLKELNQLNLKFDLGPAYLDNLKKFDIVFRTPGLPYLNEKIQRAENDGVEISSQTKYFFNQCPCLIIGVTGTKGKGTTSTLISEILKANNGKKVYLAGNIGKAPIELLDELNSDDLIVLELSSFQLQDLDKSPHISVVLDIKIDHLDVHKSEQEYVEAKTNIVSYQNEKDFAVINIDYPTSLSFADKTKAQIYYFSRKNEIDKGIFVKNKKEFILKVDDRNKILAKTDDITLRGEHNWENIAAASLAAYLAGARIEIISKIIKEFTGLEHRLEFVREINGVKYYNDSFSTTPDTAIAAIKSFSEPIVLIAGGSEKNANYTELGKIIDGSNVKAVVLMGATGPRIKEKIFRSDIKIIDNCQNIAEVMGEVAQIAISGDVVLLSPASASFDWFKNYKDRGNQFKKIITNLP